MGSLDEAAGRLSKSNIAALRRLRRREYGGQTELAEAEHLLRLGLAELNFGALALTGLGRRLADHLR